MKEYSFVNILCKNAFFFNSEEFLGGNNFMKNANLGYQINHLNGIFYLFVKG